MADGPIDADALHHEAVVVDLHADTLELVRLGYGLANEHRPFVGQLVGHVDLPRLRRGGVDGVFFGIVIPPWSSPSHAEAKVRRQTELLARVAEELGGALRPARAAQDILEARSAGAVAALVGVEGSFGLVREPSRVEALSRCGVRYLSLAHLWSGVGAPSSLLTRRGRLGAAGHDLIAELERWHVLVDLAHLARGAFLEACSIVRRPPLVSHTALRALKPIWRNIDDEQVRAVAEAGGVIGIIATPRFLGGEGVDELARHLEHLVSVGGADVAAIGTDFDGLVRPPRDLRDAAGLPRLTEALVRRGVPAADVRKILGENVLRLLREVPPLSDAAQ